MLIIRKEQMRIFREYMVGLFEDRMVSHLKKYFSDEFSLLGEEKVRNTIRYGIDRAKTYGIEIEYDVSRYINMMFTFGRDFDKNRDLLWAAEILRNKDQLGTQKMTMLYREADKHLPNVVSICKH